MCQCAFKYRIALAIGNRLIADGWDFRPPRRPRFQIINPLPTRAVAEASQKVE
jgi:hypothetical protein